MSKPIRAKAGAPTCLTEAERAVIDAIPLVIDGSRVRLYRAGCGRGAGWLRWLILRVSRDRAVALGNHVFLPDGCQDDLPVLAHELTHCGQYQAWGPWVYFRRGLAARVRELLYRTVGIGVSPYRYEMDPSKPFEAYGMEQQGQIVEDSFRGQAIPSA